MEFVPRDMRTLPWEEKFDRIVAGALPSAISRITSITSAPSLYGAWSSMPSEARVIVIG